LRLNAQVVLNGLVDRCQILATVAGSDADEAKHQTEHDMQQLHMSIQTRQRVGGKRLRRRQGSTAKLAVLFADCRPVG
jgi:hypothetical protein